MALAALGVLVGALLALEPLVWLAYERAEHAIDAIDTAVWAVEVAIGVCAAAVAATVARRRRAPA